jgi:hypothetical protein
MTHHHHHAGEPHPSPAISPSFMRLSATQRVLVVAVPIVLLWAAFLWTAH